MELVDENEGYDSEEDNDNGTAENREESKTGSQRMTAPVIDFIKPGELQPFSFGSISGAKPKPAKPVKEPDDPAASLQINDVPTFWLGGQTKKQKSAATTSGNQKKISRYGQAEKPEKDPKIDDLMSLLSSKAASSAKKTSIRTGDSEIRDELHRKSREQPDKEVTSAKNPTSREPITFLADNNSLLSGDQPQRRS